MKNPEVIKTNLSRAIILGMTALIIMLIFVIILKNYAVAIVSFLVVIIFIEYLFSKKIYYIAFNDQDVTFKYLQLILKSSTYLKENLLIRKRIEVHFRGGKNIIYEIINKADNKKIFEISKRTFKSKNDFESFLINFYPIDEEAH